MNERISTLMDGELFEDEVDTLLGKIKHHPEAQQEWQTYHLIGDILRQPSHIPRDISASLHSRLQAEPTVLAPRNLVSKKMRYFAMSAAASLTALTLLAWMSVRIGSEPVPQMAIQQPSPEIRQAVYSENKGMDDYLMAHQELSPAANVEGAATYIRTVAAR